MAKNMELAFRIASKLDASVVGNFKKTSDEMKKMQEEMKKMKAQEKALAANKAMEENMNKQHKAYLILNKDMVDASKKLQAMKKAYEDSGRSNKGLSDAIKTQEKVVNNLNKQVERQKNVFKAARSELEASTKNVDKYAKSISEARSEVDAFNKKQAEVKKLDNLSAGLKSKGKDLQSKGRSNLTTGTVVGAALVMPVKAYLEVEEAQADLKKMIDFTSKQEADGFYKAFREMSDNSNLSQVDIFQIAGAGAQAGIAKNELKQFTQDASKIKIAFDMNSAAAGDFLAKTRSQLGLSQKEVMAFADSINYLADNTAAQAVDMVDISQRVGGLARTTGVSKESNIAYGATLLSMGKSSEVASTGLKQLYLELSKGADTNKKFGAYKALGLDGEKLKQQMTTDADGAIMSVLNALNKVPKADKAGLINTLFGEQAIDSISTLSNETGTLAENIKKAHSEAAKESVNKEYKNRMSTTLNALKQGFNQVHNIFADLGKALAPSILEALNAMKPFVKSVADFVTKHPKLVSGIMKIILAFAAFKLVLGGSQLMFGGMFKSAGKLVGILSKVKKAGGVTKAFPMVGKVASKAAPIASKIGGGLAKMGPLLMNPWVLAGAVIVGIFVLLYTKSTWFRNGVNKAMKQIMPHIKEVGKVLKSFLGEALNYIHKLTVKYGPVVKKVFGEMKKFLTSAGQAGKKAFDAMKPALTVIGKIIVAVVIYAIRSFITNLKLIWTIAKFVFTMVVATIKTNFAIIKGVFLIFFAIFTGQWNKIPGLVKGVWESIKGGVNTFISAFKSMFTGVFDWFKNKWEDAKKLAGSIGSALNPGSWFGGAKGKFSGTRNWEGGAVEVAEKGRELIQLPTGQSFIAPFRTTMNLPKGTKILNNSATEAMFKPKKTSSLLDRVAGVKAKADDYFKGGSESKGTGDINMTINVQGGNPDDAERIGREVEKAIKRMKDKELRTQY